MSKIPSDTEILNWLDENARGYGKGWICRDSSTGCGSLLHETNTKEVEQTVREAIFVAMKGGLRTDAKYDKNTKTKR